MRIEVGAGDEALVAYLALVGSLAGVISLVSYQIACLSNLAI